MVLKKIELIDIPVNLEGYDHFSIAGVKVYGDPYIPLDTVYVLPDKVGRVRGYQVEMSREGVFHSREGVFHSITAFIKEFGDLPKGAVISLDIWRKILMEIVEEGGGHRIFYDLERV